MSSASTRTALLLILHGSPRPEANAPGLKIADSFRKSGRFISVELAYLECNDPAIPEAVGRCISAGADRVLAVPYFLHTGRHQVLDVPRLLMEAAATHPKLTILMTDPVGMSPLIADALAIRAEEALVNQSGQL